MEFYQRKTSAKIGFIPLVDVVFIVLLFFIVAFKFSSWELVSVAPVNGKGIVTPTPAEPKLDPPSEAKPQPEPLAEAKPASAVEPVSNTVAEPNEVTEVEYASLLLERFHKSLIYPQLAKSRNWKGEVLLSIKVGKNGELRLVRVDKTSGHALLDQAAVDAVRKATPLPAPPSGHTDFLVPLVFALP